MHSIYRFTLLSILLTLAACSGSESGSGGASASQASIAPAPPPDATPIGCQDNVFKLKFKEGEDHWVECPKQCLWGLVHGEDVYTADSAVCVAAVHAGAITAEGGAAHIKIGGRQPQFAGTERNGITTEPHGEFVTSFSFE